MTTSTGKGQFDKKMVRTSDNLARRYFDYNEETDLSTCNVGNCQKKIKGRHSGNLSRHILANHGPEAVEFTEAKLNRARAEGRVQEGRVEKTARRSKATQVQITKEDIMAGAVELVTLNGRPFSIVEDSGFRKILNPLEDALNFSLNRRNLLDEVTEKSRQMREEIKKELTGSLVSVKIDAVTRLERSFLGINVQFCRKGKVVLRNLGVKEIYGSHTASLIKCLCTSTLDCFGIKPIQIYSVTSDNARNMIKVSALLETEIEETMRAGTSVETSSESSNPVHGSSDESPRISLTEEESAQLESAVAASEEEEEAPISDGTEEEDVEIALGDTVGVRCGSHTLQLAVKDALKNQETARTISLGRQKAKAMRNPTVRAIMKKFNIRVPCLDVETRFDSEFEMIDAVLEAIKLANELDVSIENQVVWQKRKNPFECSGSLLGKLTQIRDALQPARAASKKFQTEQLLAGDFYEAWMRCKLDLKKLPNNSTAKRLLEAMDHREENLFATPSFVAALALDPRYHIMLTGPQERLAVSHLQSVWRRILQVSSENDGQSTTTSFEDTADESPETREDDPFEALLKEKERQRGSTAGTPAPTTQMCRDITVFAQDFLKTERVKTDDVLGWWELRKTSRPELYKLAMVVLAVPMTQISVERLFSFLKCVVSDRRGSMSQVSIDNVMFLGANQKFRIK